MGRRKKRTSAASLTPEQAFEEGLEILRTEAESALQFFYAYLTVHASARDTPSVHRLLNTAPLFWNTALGALQTATFIVVGRIFDDGKTAHSIGRLIDLASNNPSMFSKAALAKRRMAGAANAPAYLADYLKHVYVPKAADFSRLRGYISKHRKTYVNNYRDLRHKVFAHKEITDATQISALLARTNIRELQRMLLFAIKLYDALWGLFVNGHRPVLRPRKISVALIRKRGLSGRPSNAVHERIVEEAERFLTAAANANMQTGK